MRKFLIATVALVSIASAASAAPIDQAVNLLYAAPNSVQRAVDLDACQHWDERAENRTARARLSRRNAAAYDAIERALGDAYNASAGTDSALDDVRNAFCAAVSDR